MRILRALALAAVLAACGDDGNMQTPDARPTQMPDAPPANPTFVDFVTGLVQDHSDETSRPVDIDGLNLTGTEDAHAFDSLLGI
jgi:predicted small lipoprotein YifL